MPFARRSNKGAPERPDATDQRQPVPARRQPPGLRLNTLRKASNPTLSLIFASGDSTLPPHPQFLPDSRASSSSSASSIASGSAGPPAQGWRSEEALSRQLDGDLGGRQMGLRSRRSSSGTVGTVRTSSGMRREDSPTFSVKEEEEDGALQPGPSASVAATPKRQDTETRSTRTLNPKASASWLRWNSPAPSFPRSSASIKGKGKALDIAETSSVDSRSEPPRSDSTPRDRTVLEQSTASTPPSVTVPPPSLATTADPPPEQTGLRPSERVGKEVDGLAAPSLSSTPKPARRGWWGRTASPASTIRKAPSASETIAAEDSGTVSLPGAEEANQPIESPEASVDAHPSESRGNLDDDGPSEKAKPPSTRSTGDATQTGTPATTDTSTAPVPSAPRPVGWSEWLWGRKDAAQGPVDANETTDLDPPAETALYTAGELDLPPQEVGALADAAASTNPPARPSSGVTGPLANPAASVDTPVAPSSDSEAPPSVVQGDTPDPAKTGSRPGWGSYLYSFVGRPEAVKAESQTIAAPLPASEPPNAEVDKIGDGHGTGSGSVAGADVSRPNAQPVAVETQPEGASGTTSQPSSNADVVQTLQSPDSNAAATSRKGSTASASGWLSYLAFRASQKKITADSALSVGEPRRSAETSGVMDLSADPDFPSSSPDPGAANPGKLGAAPAPSGSKDGKLGPRDKRLSVSSTKSAGSEAMNGTTSRPSSTRLGVSPKASAANLKASITGKASSSSALPGQPAPPASQPNFVIPTFETTFDRPPRSLAPLPDPTTPDGKGLTAATTGLAWKALSVAGSYVLPAQADSAGKGTTTPTQQGAAEGQETRGLKEGRMIGAELPRRIGLQGGSADDGWKHVRRVVVVGVHGWFPAKMLNSVIGEPTGTSSKFANMMGAAVTKFFEAKGITDLRLTLMPLEGEGTIDNRVDKLFKAFLANPAWINDLRRADAIFFAAHSQGCIVTTHLIARLIAQGHIRTPYNREAVSRCEWYFGPVGVLPPEEPRRGRKAASAGIGGPAAAPGSEGGCQKVAMLAMCGVHLGPFYSINSSAVIQPYLQWFENAAARELFEFQDSASAVSEQYRKALSMVLENEVRIVLLASLNDQVVPIYGASFMTANHPLLLRALYVDGASYSSSDFMTQLLSFAFMLRNAGIDDQRLVEHLSEATAGGLTGVGHSSPYEEPAVYALAVEYLFCAGPAKRPIPPLSVEPFNARDVRNDFELPWIMRALVDDPAVKDLFPSELQDLREGVQAWRPITKALKEIKKRLEPMAGRQSRLRMVHGSPGTNGPSSVVDSQAKKEDMPGLRRDW